MKKAIVTGANGFVGVAICRELSKNNVQVIAVVRSRNADISNLAGLEQLRIVYCELKDYNELEQMISDRDIDIFYHMAWSGTSGSLRGDSEVQTDNIRYTCDAVKVCARMCCKRFVYAASIMEYETEKAIKEELPVEINTIYCTAKLAADYMARALANDLKIEYIRAVISNIYGPGEVSARLINTSIRKLLKNEHCAFSPGEQLYDFIYITDAAKTFLSIGEKGISNRTYYVGSLQPKPLKKFLTAMKNQINPKAEIGLGEIPFEGVSLSYQEFDIQAVQKDTGFVPEVSFEEGIRLTAEWIKSVEE